MKSFKIVNSFVFLFVINLSITFLNKNNLFATFINGVLQTENNNLYQRKQRNLAESENLSVTDAYKSSNNASQVYMDKFCGIEIFTFKDMLNNVFRAPAGSKDVTAYNKDLYDYNYLSRASFEGIDVLDRYNAFSRYLTYIQMLSSLEDIHYNIDNVYEKISNIHSLAKNIVNMYIEESDKKLRDEISKLDYITKFISSNYTPHTPEHEIKPEDVFELVEAMIYGLKLDNYIS